MNDVVVSSLVLVMSAGAAFGAVDEEPVALVPSSGPVVQAAHIYYNIMTGERVVTVIGDGDGQTQGAHSQGPIWSSMVNNVCADFGYTTTLFFGFDNNSGTSSLATDITVLDFGDIALDSLVDMVHIDWVTGHDDVDLDSDGVGDGVAGLGGEWTYWDMDNGRISCTRLPLISFQLIDLPGNIGGEGALTKYTLDIDLVGSFSSGSMAFEIGDSDGDLQGAAFGHNNVDTDGDGIGDGVSIANADRNFDGVPDSDIDGDGLFDWSWTVRFAQPGTRDLDGDGVNDGDLGDSFKTIGVSFGAAAGRGVDNGDGTFTWEINTTNQDAGTGQEDAFAIYAPPLGGPNGEILHAGFFWFGGYECAGGLGYTPVAAFEHQLFGPTNSIHYDCGDFNGDGSLNFFDVSAFLELFAAQDVHADLNGDGAWNFFDISAFLAQLAAGCP